MAAPAAYESSQARGRIRAAAAGPHHSHSNIGSELLLGGYMLVLVEKLDLNPMSEDRDGTCILTDTMSDS